MTTLTKREYEITAMVEAGLLNKQIAWALGTQEQTIRNQLRVIFLKTGVRNRAALKEWERGRRAA